MALGATEEEARAFVGAEPEPAECYVYKENWDVVMLFQRVQTQWRTSGGLDYPAVESVMRIFKVKDKAAMFDRLRIMESAVLESADDADQ